MANSRIRQKERMQKIVEESKRTQKGAVPFYRRYSKLLIGLFLILATALVFWPVRNHEFLNYDDNEYVTENLQVRGGLTLKGFIWVFSTVHAANWHPLTWLSHMLDYDLYGLARRASFDQSVFSHR